MGILSNSSWKACLRLAGRMIRINRTRAFFLCLSIILVTILYTMIFFTSSSVYDSYLLQDQQEYGSTNHIVFDGLSEHQAQRISRHENVKKAVELYSIGTLSDEMLEYRTIRLAAADSAYAQTVSAIPDAGHMPEREGEIALDIMTLDSLGLRHKTGQKVRIQWQDGNGTEHTDTFVLCGYWSGENIHTESCAWIVPKEARRLLADSGAKESITLGVTLYQPEDLDKQAEEILDSLGLEEITYTTNYSYNSARMETANARAFSYLINTVFVVAGGFLLIYTIMAVSRSEQIAFLASVKSLGMTPSQTGIFTSLYSLLLCVPAVPGGLLVGFAVFYHISRRLIAILTGITVNLEQLEVYPAVWAAVCGVLTAWGGCFFSTFAMCRRTPAGLRKYLNQEFCGRKRKSADKITVWRMACRMMNIGKRTFISSIILLLMASVLLGGSYIRYVSYDEDYYAREMFLSDYSFMDASCAGSYQRYNERAGNITAETAKKIRNCPEVKEYGEFLTHEIDLTADSSLRKEVVDFYNQIDAYSGTMTRKESMSSQPGWIAGLEQLEETGRYRSVLIGAEGLVMDYVLYSDPLDGTFDPEKFATGEYVLSVGAAADDGLSAAPAGTKVEIAGRTFTVMASIQEWGIVPAGLNSRDAEFSLNYVMPSDTIRELYPDINIRQIMVNIDREKAEQFEKTAASILKEGGIVMERRSDEMQEFRKSARAAVSVGAFAGILLFVISILGLLNVIMTKILSRRREFALYQSLGMEKKQIRRMVFYEGVTHGLISVAAAIPAAAVSLKYGMEMFYNSSLAYISNNDWAVTYHYSVLPFILMAAVLLGFSLLVPQLCLNRTEQKSVVERMRYKE